MTVIITAITIVTTGGIKVHHQDYLVSVCTRDEKLFVFLAAKF